MGYNKDQLLQQIIEIIPEHKVVFIEELVSYLPCDKSTFYALFPINSDDSNKIKELINDNKVKTKANMRKKWEDSDNATLQMGLYKLLGSEEERERLNTSYAKTDVTTNGKSLGQPLISFIETDEEESE